MPKKKSPQTQNVVTVYTQEEGRLKSRLTNVGTIISLVSIIVVVLMQLNIIDVAMSETIKVLVYLGCGAGVVLGVLNNPKGSGIYLPGVDYPLWGTPAEAPIIKIAGQLRIDSGAIQNKLEAKQVSK